MSLRLYMAETGTENPKVTGCIPERKRDPVMPYNSQWFIWSLIKSRADVLGLEPNVDEPKISNI